MKLTKRILSLLVCMALVIGFIPVFAQPARAEEQTIKWDASVLGKTTITFKSTIVGDNLITLSASKNGGSNDPAYNKDGTLRLYNKNQLVITPSANITLTKVEFVTTGSSYDMDTTNFSVSAGTLTTGTKTASITNINGASSITLTSSKSSQIRISDIIFTYTTNGGNTPACTHADATITHNNGMHIKTCPNVECGVVEEEAYTVTTAFDADGHWEEYSCGCKTESTAHTLVDEKCECGYEVPETDDYVKVTNVSDLKVGDKIIIVAAGYDYALSTTQNNNNRAVTAITKNADKISVEENGPVQILTLEAGTVEGTFAFYTGSGYLYAASSSSNNLKTQTTNNDNGSWLITIDAEGVASIIARGSNTRNVLKYNSSSTLFSCYDSNNSQLAVAIYKLQKETHTHDYAENVTAPTCTEAGYTTYTCACGDTKIDNEVAALGHSYNAAVTAPTCTAGGYTTYTCANCSDSYVGDEVAATGHAWGEGVVNPKPTCNDAGTKTYTCGKCDDTYTEAVSAKGHTAGNAVVENNVAASCTAAGSYDTVVYCSVCGAELSRETTTVPTIDHSYTSEVTKQPTLNEEGVETFTCACGDSYTQSVAKLEGGVAIVNGMKYATLQEAINAAVDGDVVQILEGEFVLGNEKYIIDKAITIQGAGKDKTTLKFEFSGAASAFTISSDDVTIKDLTIAQSKVVSDTFFVSIARGAYGAYDVEYANITISNVAFVGGKYALCITAENIIIDSCDFTNQDSSNIIIYAVQGDSKITNSVFTTANGGKYAIMMEGGTSGAAATMQSTGTLTIDGNTSTGIKLFFIFNNYGRAEDLTLNITNNAISNCSNKPIAFTAGDGSEEFAAINITNNKFTNIVSGRPVIKDERNGANEVTIQMSHNYWGSEEPDFDALAISANINIYPYYADEALTMLVDKAVATVTDSEGKVTTYASLQEALDAAQNGETVKLLADVAVSKYLDVYTANNGAVARDFTLDLNGYTISPAADYKVTDYPVLFVGLNQTLTITGEGKITSNAGVTVGVYGILNVVGGTIESTGNTDKDGALCVWHWTPGNGYYEYAIGSAAVSGGAVVGGLLNEGSLAVTGGEIDSVELNHVDATIETALELNISTDIEDAKVDYVDGAYIIHVHAWNDATCTEPKKCACGETKDAALGHNYEGVVTTEPTLNAEGIKTFTCSGCGDSYTETLAKLEGAVAEINDYKYATLQEAVNVGGEIVLLSDVALTETLVIPAGKVITLDLNGYTVSMEDASATACYMIKNYGTLTIKDGSAEQTGKLTFNSTTPSSDNSYSVSTIGNGGNLIVESGLIENTTNGSAAYAIDTLWYNSEVSVTVNGGTVKGAKIAIRQVLFSTTAQNTLNITDGTVTGSYAAVQTHNYSGVAALSDVNISGGTLSGSYAYYTYYSDAGAHAGTDIAISGGTFNGYLFIYNGKAGSDVAEFANVAITGGTFNGGVYVYTKDADGNAVNTSAISGGTFAEDATDYCVDGYHTVANDEGKYVPSTHEYAAVVTAPTCTEAGYTTYTCTCGDSYVADEVAAKGHTAGTAVKEDWVSPSANADGSYNKVVYCTTCGEKLSSEAVVVKMPNATVTIMDSMILTPEDDYMCWPGGATDIDRLLQIVMNFQANETLEQAKAGEFGDYLVDFYLTLSGLSGDSIVADNCYLAGNYGTFGWIVIVPEVGTTLEGDVTYPIVSTYDATLNYKDICGSVKNFTAAIYIDPAILEANPNMTVTLELKMTNPENADDVMVIGEPAVYTVSDLKAGNAEAQIGNNYYATLQEAMNVAGEGDTIKLLANAELNALVLMPGVSLDLNGYTLETAYVVGFKGSDVIDSSAANTGLLKVGMDSVMLSLNNSQLPVYNAALGGYQFLEINIKTQLTEDTANDVATLKFYIVKNADYMMLLDLMRDGAADNNLTVMVKLSWITEGDGELAGNKATQYYAYSENMNIHVAETHSTSQYSTYTCELKGINSRESISYAAVLQSGTDAELTFAGN